MRYIRGPCLVIALLAFIGAASPQNDRLLNNDDSQPAFTDSTATGDSRVDIDLLYENHACAANLLTIGSVFDLEATRPAPAIMIVSATSAPPPFDEMPSPVPVYTDMLEHYGYYGQEGRSADATMADLYAAKPRHRTHHQTHKQRNGKRHHHRV